MKLKASFNVILGLLTSLVIIFSSSCTKGTIKVSQESPPIFYLSGNYQVMGFDISNKSEVIWRISPRGRKSLSELSIIKYGEVLPSYFQLIPEESKTPPTLLDGVDYWAVALVADRGPIKIHFMIKDGKVVELPSS